MMAPAGPLLRTLLLAPLVLALASAFADPAHASEKRMMGDVTVPEEATVEEAQTGWGSVLVEGEVRGDVRSGYGEIRVRGPVGGDVEAGSGEVLVDAPVGGDVHVGHGDVSLGDEASVGGDVSLANGSVGGRRDAIAGELETAMMATGFDEAGGPPEFFSDLARWVVTTLVLSAAAVLLAVVAPRPLRASARSFEVSPGRSFLLGLGFLPAAFILSVLLVVVGVGLLLIPLLLALVVFGLFVAVYFLGRRAVLFAGHYRAGDPLAAVVGAVLVALVALIPFLGGLVFALLALLGAGAAVSALLALRRRTGWDAPRATYASYEEYLKDRGG